MEYRHDSLNPWDEENPRPYQRYRRELEQEHADYRLNGNASTWSIMWTGFKNLMCRCCVYKTKHASN